MYSANVRGVLCSNWDVSSFMCFFCLVEYASYAMLSFHESILKKGFILDVFFFLSNPMHGADIPGFWYFPLWSQESEHHLCLMVLASLIATSLIFMLSLRICWSFVSHSESYHYKSFIISIDVWYVVHVPNDGCSCNEDLEVEAGGATCFFIFTTIKPCGHIDKRPGRKRKKEWMILLKNVE